MARRIGSVAGFLLAMGLAIGTHAPAAMAADAQTIRIGTPPGEAGVGAIPFVSAQRNGYFAREGVNIQIVPISGPNAMDTVWNIFDALAKGDVDLVNTQVPFLLEQVVMKGRDFVAISANQINPPYGLVARPDIKNFADLKGKTVGLTRPNDAITIGSRKMMELHGLGANDVTIKAVEGSTARYECLKSGECAATTLTLMLDFDAAKRGYNRLGSTAEAGVLFGVDIISSKWGQAHQDLVVHYVRAMADGLRFVNDPKNDAALLKLIAELAKTDDAGARQILNSYRNPKNNVFSRQGEIDMKAFAETIALEGKYGHLQAPLPPATRFVDTRYLMAAGIK